MNSLIGRCGPWIHRNSGSVSWAPGLDTFWLVDWCFSQCCDLFEQVGCINICTPVTDAGALLAEHKEVNHNSQLWSKLLNLWLRGMTSESDKLRQINCRTHIHTHDMHTNALNSGKTSVSRAQTHSHWPMLHHTSGMFWMEGTVSSAQCKRPADCQIFPSYKEVFPNCCRHRDQDSQSSNKRTLQRVWSHDKKL